MLTLAKHILPGVPRTLVKNMMEIGMWQDTSAGTSGHPWGPHRHHPRGAKDGSVVPSGPDLMTVGVPAGAWAGGDPGCG